MLPQQAEQAIFEKLHPFTLTTSLTGYMPVPRELLVMELPSTAILLYAVLLDRSTLSQKNRYSDETGAVYVIYPIDKLAETLFISDTAVKRNLKVLEQKGLIWKMRETKNGPNHIFLNVPERIFDRILEMCIPVCFDGESLRLAKGKENLKLYKQLTGK